MEQQHQTSTTTKNLEAHDCVGMLHGGFIFAQDTNSHSYTFACFIFSFYNTCIVLINALLINIDRVLI